MIKQSNSSWPKSRNLAGKYEYVDIPTHNLFDLPATLDPYFQHNYLTVKDWFVFEKAGVPKVGFTLPPHVSEVGHSSTITDTIDYIWPDGTRDRQIEIAVLLKLGGRRLKSTLRLTSRKLRSTELILGSRILSRHVEVDPALAFLMSTPKIGLKEHLSFN